MPMALAAHICCHPLKPPLPVWWFVCHSGLSLSPCGCLSVRPPRTHNPLLWIQGDSYPRPPPSPACLPLASIKTCLCMYVCAEGNTGRFFKGWGEISRGIWGRWIWMGSLLLESTADREVNSSWPEEGRRGRGGGIGWCMHWHTFEAWLYRSLSVTHSPSLRTIYHYSFTSSCCCIVKLLLLDNLVDYDNEVLLSIHARELADGPEVVGFSVVRLPF